MSLFGIAIFSVFSLEMKTFSITLYKLKILSIGKTPQKNYFFFTLLERSLSSTDSINPYATECQGVNSWILVTCLKNIPKADWTCKIIWWPEDFLELRGWNLMAVFLWYMTQAYLKLFCKILMRCRFSIDLQ